MSKQIKKSIGWTDMTCNPIKGRCLGGCWYCYYSGKGKMLDFREHDPTIRLQLSAFNALPKIPKKVFLCSTHDLFGSWISENWRDLIFDHIKKYPQHTFQILTKFPQNIDRDMPDNVWLGVSITGVDDLEMRSWDLIKAKARLKFWSLEPLLNDITWPMIKSERENIARHIDWLIIGKLTGHGNKYDPKKTWIKNIVLPAEKAGIPIFLKDNLKDIWGDDLIQEFP